MAMEVGPDWAGVQEDCTCMDARAVALSNNHEPNCRYGPRVELQNNPNRVKMPRCDCNTPEPTNMHVDFCSYASFCNKYGGPDDAVPVLDLDAINDYRDVAVPKLPPLTKADFDIGSGMQQVAGNKPQQPQAVQPPDGTTTTILGGEYQPPAPHLIKLYRIITKNDAPTYHQAMEIDFPADAPDLPEGYSGSNWIVQ